MPADFAEGTAKVRVTFEIKNLREGFTASRPAGKPVCGFCLALGSTLVALLLSTYAIFPGYSLGIACFSASVATFANGRFRVLRSSVRSLFRPPAAGHFGVANAAICLSNGRHSAIPAGAAPSNCLNRHEPAPRTDRTSRWRHRAGALFSPARPIIDGIKPGVVQHQSAIQIAVHPLGLCF